MGKMKNGILDAFSGTIGRVVGTSWRGVAVMRSKAHSPKMPILGSGYSDDRGELWFVADISRSH